VKLAHQLINQSKEVSKSPYTVSQVVRAVGISRGSFYQQSILEQKDKQLAVAIEQIHEEEDDTLGHKKLAPMLKTGKNRVLRVMKKYAIKPRRRTKRYHYPGKSDVIFTNLANAVFIQLSQINIVFSDIFEFQLVDGSKIRGCFALRKDSRQILSLVFDYSMKAELVVTTIQRIDVVDPESIWHTDQGKQYGASITLSALLEKGFIASMSRAGTPTDNPYAERFVGIFKHAVVHRRRYQTLGEFLDAAKQWINFYNNRRPHESLGQMSPNDYARKHNIAIVPNLSCLTVY
jgi:putative transposase